MHPNCNTKIVQKMDKKQTAISMLDRAKELVSANEMKAASLCVRSIVELLKTVGDGE